MLIKGTTKEQRQELTKYLHIANSVNKINLDYARRVKPKLFSKAIVHWLTPYSSKVRAVTKQFPTKTNYDLITGLEELRNDVFGDELRLDWVFLLQESSARILSMVDKTILRGFARKNLDLANEYGESFNNFIRENMQIIEKEDEQQKGMEDSADDVCDVITDLLLNLKEKK